MTILAVAGLGWCATVALAQPRYDVIDLGTLGGPFANGLDVDDDSRIVGQAEESDLNIQAFIWEDGIMTQLNGLRDDPGSGRANAIGRTFAAGSSFAESGTTHPVIYDLLRNQEAIDLDPEGGNSTRAGSAWGLCRFQNELLVVGQRFRTAFYWRPSKGFVDMGVYPGADERFGSVAYDVNDDGRIVGETAMPDFFTHAFRWTFDNGWEDLGTLGGNRSYAFAVSERNEIVGGAQVLDGGIRPFLRRRDGKMVELPMIANYHSGDGRDINDRGQIVGDNWNGPIEDPLHAFLYEDGVTHDLNDLIDPNSAWNLTSAIGINNRGEITGIGVYNDLSRAYLLRPIDPGMNLAGPNPGRAGIENELIVYHAEPGRQVYFVYGFEQGSTKLPGCDGVTVDINRPRAALKRRASLAGHIRVMQKIPAAFEGQTVYLQAVQPGSCRVSNLIEITLD